MKQLQSRWPAWFPYPSAWLQTLILLILLIPVGASLRFFGTIGWGTLTATGNLGFAILFAAIGIIAPFVAFAYVHSRLGGEFPKRWPHRIPAPQSIWEAFYALSVMVIAILLALASSYLFVDARRTYRPEVQRFMLAVFSVTWIVMAAYLYQVKFLIWKGIVAVIEKRFSAKIEADKAAARQASDDVFGAFGVNPPPPKK